MLLYVHIKYYGCYIQDKWYIDPGGVGKDCEENRNLRETRRNLKYRKNKQKRTEEVIKMFRNNNNNVQSVHNQ